MRNFAELRAENAQLLDDFDVMRAEHDKFLATNNHLNAELLKVEPCVTRMLDEQRQEIVAGWHQVR